MTTTKSNNKSTHRGTCQACGRVQCVTLHTDKLAKHGYTVDWGHFNGVCAGADVQPLELNKTLTEHIIHDLRENVAPRADKLAADLRSGAVAPKYYRHEFDKIKRISVRVECRRDELPIPQDYNAGQCLSAAIYNAENRAKGARQHADSLEKLIASRHGQPLMPIVSAKTLTVGARVLIGGKDGVICEVVEIKGQIARGQGPYLNGQFLQHAFCKRDDGRVFAVPTRSIRQSSILD